MIKRYQRTGISTHTVDQLVRHVDRMLTVQVLPDMIPSAPRLNTSTTVGGRNCYALPS